MKFDRPTVHSAILLFGLALMAVGMGVSLFLMSLGGMIISANWLAEGRFQTKLQHLWANKPALWLVGLFLLHIVWLWNTDNFDYALKDIRIKLPLLFLPVVLGAGANVPRRAMFGLLWLFVATVFVGSSMAVYYYFAVYNPATENIREIVFFSSPIRFALLCDMALMVVIYHAFSRRIHWIWAAIAAVWFIGFLVVLQSLTGLALLAAIAVFMAFYHGICFGQGWQRFLWLGIPLLFSLGSMGALVKGFIDYREPENTPENGMELVTHTAGGEAYTHHPANTELQDGHYIHRYIAFGELEKAWERSSTFDFDGKDSRGQALRYTLIRYMASKGLRKDSVGFRQLSEQDIARIEQGHTSANPPTNPIIQRLEGTFFEINAYLNGASGQGSSVVQRLIYFRTGWAVAARNWAMGVGTGDVNDTIMAQYDREQSALDADYRRRSHNQYLAFWIAFGLVGLVYFFGLNLNAIVVAASNAHFLGLAFAVIAALSFLTEDTLETQVGATFFAFFYALFFCLQTTDSAGQKFRFDEVWRDARDGRLDQ